MTVALSKTLASAYARRASPARTRHEEFGIFSDTLVGRFVLLEPTGDVEHFGDVMAGPAADAVWFFGDADQHGVNIEKLEGRIKLFGFGDRGAIVGFARHD